MTENVLSYINWELNNAFGPGVVKFYNEEKRTII